MRPRLDGCRGAAQRGCSLFDREPFDVAQDDDGSLVERQLLDRLNEPLDVRTVRYVGDGHLDLDEHLGRSPRTITPPVADQVQHDSTRVGLRVSTSDPPAPRRPRERYLNQILSSAAIPAQQESASRQLARGVSYESLELTLVRSADHRATFERAPSIRPTPSKLRYRPEGFADTTPISDRHFCAWTISLADHRLSVASAAMGGRRRPGSVSSRDQRILGCLGVCGLRCWHSCCLTCGRRTACGSSHPG